MVTIRPGRDEWLFFFVTRLIDPGNRKMLIAILEKYYDKIAASELVPKRSLVQEIAVSLAKNC